MPLPLLGLLAIPAVKAGLALAGIATAGGLATSKYAEHKSGKQEDEASDLLKKIGQLDNDFAARIQPVMEKCLELAANAILEADAIAKSAGINPKRRYDIVDPDVDLLPPDVKGALDRIDNAKFTAIGSEVRFAEDSDVAKAWRNVSPGHIHALTKLPAQYGHLAIVAFAGTTVYDAGKKLLNVRENEKKLNILRAEYREREEKYDTGMKAAEAELPILESSSRVVLNHMAFLAKQKKTSQRNKQLKVMLMNIKALSPTI